LPDAPVVVAPTQDPALLNASTVTDFANRIAAGVRPAAIVYAYSMWRINFGSQQEHRSITGFIIDGHHKLAAYSNLKIPARVLLICDREPRQPAFLADPLTVFDDFLGD
jgi:hypothetical protein